MSAAEVRYIVTLSKSDQRTSGPDDAEITMTVPLDIAATPDFDATVEFMRGRLKAVGHTGQILDLLQSGVATSALTALSAS